MTSRLTKHKVHRGTTLSCDLFYSSQGRIGKWFNDGNEELRDHYTEKFDIKAIEMETFQLYFLAHIAKEEIYTAATSYIILNHGSPKILTNQEKSDLERDSGIAILDSLIEFKVEESTLMKGNCVWES